MMTQEEYMNVKALRAAGWTISQIAEHVGYHPATVSGWSRNGGPRAQREIPAEELVVDDGWKERIAALLAHNAQLQGSSIMRVITAERFGGSYQSLTRLEAIALGRHRHLGPVADLETTPGRPVRLELGAGD